MGTMIFVRMGSITEQTAHKRTKTSKVSVAQNRGPSPNEKVYIAIFS
jgi:hypothetical protein